MNIIYSPRQSGRTTAIIENAVEMANYGYFSVIVVPSSKIASSIKNLIRHKYCNALDVTNNIKWNQHRDNPENMLIVPFREFADFANDSRMIGRRSAKIFIDDLDSCLQTHSIPYGTVEAITLEKKEED